MTFDLAAELPRLLPKAIAWAEVRSKEVASRGVSLSPLGVRLALAVGVQRPDLIRVMEVSKIPLPQDAELKLAATQTGLIGNGTTGLTLGHSIYIVTGHNSNRLLSHESRHVFQYEKAGSIANFLRVYLQQMVQYGYDRAPFEIDARKHELENA
jgi:hypothetical protein